MNANLFFACVFWHEIRVEFQDRADERKCSSMTANADDNVIGKTSYSLSWDCWPRSLSRQA